MAQIGRNQPCPCGSGRKFKRCHGRNRASRTSPEDATWHRLRRVLDGYPTMMLRLVRDAYGPSAIQEAWVEFLLWEDDDAEFDPGTPHMQVFMPWFFHAWAPDPQETSIEDVAIHDRPPTATLLKSRGRRLDPLLRRYLDACVHTSFSFHEIVRCEPGVGFRPRDVFAGEERDVLERSASGSFQVGDIFFFFGQVVTCDGVTLMEACGPHPIPPGEKIGLIDLRERMERSRHPPAPETQANRDIELRQAYLDLTERLVHPSTPVLQNTDGDDLVFHRLSFEIGSPQGAFDVLKDLAFDETESELLQSADRDEEGRLQRVSFLWKAASDRKGWDNVVLGQIGIDGSRLVANVNSAERAALFRRILEERLGGEARHLRTAVQSVQDALEGEPLDTGSPNPSDDAALSEHPGVRERLQELMAAHYDGWVSEEIPALGGLTPLEVVRTPAGRERVEALIAQIERAGRRMEPPLDDAIPWSLRRRLGLV